MKVLSISLTEKKDRTDLFLRICELLSLSKEKEAQRVGIKNVPKFGYQVSISSLFQFLYDNKIVVLKCDFSEKFLSVACDVVPSVGVKSVKNPETIKETSVDILPKKNLPGAPDGSEKLSPLPPELQPTEDDLDDLF